MLTKAMQVIVAVDWLSGTKTVGMNTGHEYGYEAVVPMLFTPGSSTSLSLESLPSSVPYGTKRVAAVHRSGPSGGQPGELLPARLQRHGGVRRPGPHRRTQASRRCPSRPPGTPSTGARLVSGGNETSQSPTRHWAVTRGVALAVKKKGKKKVKFTATLTPGTGAGSVLLQRKDQKLGWVTVKSGTPAASVVWTLKPPKGKSWWRVLLPAGPTSSSRSATR